MDYFSIVTDKDIFENPIDEPTEFTVRPTAKGIIIDNEENICVYTIHGRSLFPGGGVEDNETPEQAFVREAKEEVGCDVKVLTYLGVAVEFRNKPAKKYEISFFVARLIGDKGIPTSTQEDEQGMVIEWLPREKVLLILESQEKNLAKDVYMPYFACRTHLAAFKKFLKSQ